MDQQLLDMIREWMNKNDADHATILATLQTHITKDEEYWRKIDVQQGQMSLLRRGFYVITVAAGVVAGWLGLK